MLRDMSCVVDSHCHLDCFDDVDDVVERARKFGIAKLLTISTQINDFKKIATICDRFPQYVYATIGVHPDYAFNVSFEDLDRAFLNIKNKFVVGVGEIGLDYRSDISDENKKQQQKVFEYQLNLATCNNVPVCIHTRNAISDTLDVVRSFQKSFGVFHCFGEDVCFAREVLDLGYMISLSGVVTFKNAHTVHEVAKFVPIDRLLVETDSPYLAPVPYRGKRNEPAYVKFVADKISELRNVDPTYIYNKTTKNFMNCFNI
ncbi:MAG: TatD family hydrolase [Holosporales bacterium]|jgi:TatD DNase family protein|nr:TatD family hydrolase [Holosporales bacterium]